MRILVLIIKYTLMIGLGLIILAGLSRETLLFWGMIQVRGAENKMELTAAATRKADYDQQCRQKSGAAVQQVQLRFTSDTEYQLEAVCGFFSNDPIVIENYKLPPLVKKAKGQAGFVWDPNNKSGVVLEVYGRKTSVVLDGKSVKIIQGAADLAGKQPVASCPGFGYECCSPETQVGIGAVFTQASDCVQSCYTSCQPRPSVLKFTSDPNPDLKSRTALVAKGAPMTFYYVIDPGKTPQATSVMQFGDDQSQTFSEKDGNFTHTYQCAKTECKYTATLTVTDQNGLASVLTPVATITVVIR